MSFFTLAPVIFTVPLRADAGTSVTIGNDHYVFGDLNADVDVSSTVNVGIYYARYNNDFIPPTNIYSADINLQKEFLFAGFVGYYSPESARYEFYGGQATVGAQGERGGMKGDLSVTYGRTLNQLYGVTGPGSRPLHENVLNPSLDLVYKKTIALRLSYSYYFHQEDPTAFFEAQFGNPQSLPGILLVVSGYPSREAVAGISWYPNDNWQYALDLDRTLYEGLAVQLNTLTWSATYYPTSQWGVSGSYALGNGALWYFTLGLQWYPGGHKRGEEKQNAITYNNIP